MNTDKFPFKKTFQTDGEAFTAFAEAKSWLKEKEFSIGTMCLDEPIGLKKGLGIRIEKWKNLTQEHKAMLDGVMTSDDFRDGDIIVHLSKDPG